MGIVKKQGFINTMIGYAGIVIGFVNIAFLFPKFFSPENFGLRAFLMESSVVFSQIALLGFSGVTNRFFPYFKDNSKDNNGFLFLIISIPFISFSIFAFCFYMFQGGIITLYENSSPLVTQYFLLILPLTFFWMYMNIFEVYSRVFLKTIASNLIKEIVLRLFHTVLILCYAQNWINIDQFWYAFILSYGLALLVLIIYVYAEGNLTIKPNFDFMTRPMLKQMLFYGFFVMFSGAAGMIVTKIDTIMLSFMTDLNKTGVYALAIYIATFIDTPRRALNQITDPLVANAWKDNDLKTIESIYIKTSINQLIVGGSLFMLIWLNIDEMFMIIPKREIYAGGKYVILFMGLAKVLGMVTGNNGEIIGFSRYYRFGFLAIFLLAILTVITNYIFIPIYGITGAAIAASLSILIYNVIKYLFLLFKFKLQPFNFNTLLAVALLILSYIIISMVTLPVHFLISIAVKSALHFILFIVPVIYLQLSPDLTDIVKKKLPFFPVKG